MCFPFAFRSVIYSRLDVFSVASSAKYTPRIDSSNCTCSNLQVCSPVLQLVQAERATALAAPWQLMALEEKP